MASLYWIFNIQYKYNEAIKISKSAVANFLRLQSINIHRYNLISSSALSAEKGKNQTFTTTCKVDYTDVTQLKLQKIKRR